MENSPLVEKGSETKSDQKPIGYRWFLLCLLIVPLIATWIVTQFFPLEQSQWCDDTQDYLELVAPFLVAAALIVYAGRSAITKNPLAMLMTGLALAFLFREIHWDWTNKGVYIMVAMLGVIGGIFHKKMLAVLRDRRQLFWLVAVIAAYAIATILDRRALKNLSTDSFHQWDKIYHSLMEELSETVAHIVLLISAIAGSWKRKLKS